MKITLTTLALDHFGRERFDEKVAEYMAAFDALGIPRPTGTAFERATVHAFKQYDMIVSRARGGEGTT